MVLALLLAGTATYLFLKPADYIAAFNTETSTGNLFHEINAYTTLSDSLTVKNEIAREEYRYIEQEIAFKERNYKLRWEVEQLTDSSSRVTLKVTEPGNSLRNRALMYFEELPVELHTKELIYDFKDILDDNLDRFRVRVVGESVSPDSFCACYSTTSTPEKKAREMMRHYNYITGFLNKHELPLRGNPMVQVTDYNEETNEIAFDFCFPVDQTDSLPEHPEIFYKKIEASPSIKAVFNGNYIHSNRAWYSIYDYAVKRDKELAKLPLEIYHDNPNQGGNELAWTTEIFMPLAN